MSAIVSGMSPTDKQLPDDGATLMRPAPAAEKLHVTTRTLQRMAERGQINAVKLPSGHRRYRLQDIEALLGGAA